MEVQPTVFWAVGMTYMLLALTYPCALLWTLRSHKEDALRWLKNTPTFTIYLPFVLAPAAALTFGTFPWEDLTAWRGLDVLLAFAVLVLLIGLAVFAALQDLKRKQVEPFMFQNPGRILKREREIRERVASGGLQASREELLMEYQAAAPSHRSVSTVLERGSLCAIASLGLNTLAGVTVAFFFWAHLMTLYGLQLDKQASATSLGLLLVFFPLRIYSEWYLHFKSTLLLKNYWAFWFLMIAAGCAYAFYMFTSDGLPRIFALVIGGINGVVGFVGKVKPEWLGVLGEVIEEMPPAWYGASVTLVVLSLLGMVGAMAF